jgi:hypothetical protein
MLEIPVPISAKSVLDKVNNKRIHKFWYLYAILKLGNSRSIELYIFMIPWI